MYWGYVKLSKASRDTWKDGSLCRDGIKTRGFLQVFHWGYLRNGHVGNDCGPGDMEEASVVIEKDGVLKLKCEG